MQRKYSNLKDLFIGLKIQQRYVRRSAKKSPPVIAAETNKNSIENAAPKKKPDLNKYNASLSTIARLALESDINLLKLNGGESLLNKQGQIELKSIKFSFDPQKNLDDFYSNSSKKTESKKDDAILSDLKQRIDSRKIDAEKVFKKDIEKDVKPVPVREYENVEEQYEDPNVPVSKVSCSGCGTKLHCQSESKSGFMAANVFKSLNKTNLAYAICQRCERIQRNKKLLNTETTPFDYDNFILKQICSKPKAHVILLVDLLNIPNSIYEGWSKLIEKNEEDEEKEVKNSSSGSSSSQLPEKFIKRKFKNSIDICIIGNKFDLLPNTGPLFRESILDCLIKHVEDKGITGKQISYVDLISAKTGYNIEKMISNLFELWNDEGDVYLLGMANAGKSVLFNQLLSSDYCRSLASQALNKSTTSFWPGTTLNTLKFPINFMDAKKFTERSVRLKTDKEKFYELEKKKS